MNVTPWKLLSVSEFLDRYRGQSELRTIGQKTSSPQIDLIWQKQTVQTFFSNIQWIPVATSPSTTGTFGLQLSVQSYFQQFEWSAPTPVFETEIQTPDIEMEDNNSINLQDFSDLF